MDFYGKIANGVLDASFGPNGELATCGRDCIIRLWAADGKELKSFPIASDSQAKDSKRTGQTPNGITTVPLKVE